LRKILRPLAKITRPVVARAVVRRRLFRVLDRARQRPLTWVWGLPGAGKTTLVASYVVARPGACLWYHVDDGDRDVATSFYYLGQAAPRRRHPLPMLTSEYHRALSAFSHRFFRELYRRLKPPFTLVFDDYHDVLANAEFHDAIVDGLAELPAGGRVIVISRGGPPPAFARLRTQQAIEMLESSQLRFTVAEACELIRKLAPGRWSRATIRALYASSDGWAAGLVLLIEQLRSQGQTSWTPARPPADVLFDYFAGEIFKTLDPETRDVLLQTALVPSVTASMAETLTGQPAAGKILNALHQKSYFTNKLAGAEPTYQYHPLFRGFLVAQARKHYTTERVAEIRRAAAGLVEDTGQVEVAAALWRAAAGHHGLAGLICRHAPTLLGQGRRQLVLAWIGSLPEALFDEIPWLHYWRGMCHFAWRHAESQRDLQHAFTAFRQRRDHTGMFASWSAIIIAYQGESNTDPMDEWIALLDELLRDIPQFPSEEIEMRVATAMLSAINVRQPGHPDGARWAEKALELTRRYPDPNLRAITAFNWYLYHFEMGEFAKVGPVADEMRAVMAARDVAPVVALHASMTVALHEFVFALPSYRRTVTDMLELAWTAGIADAAKHVLLLVGLFSALSEGDMESVDRWLQETDRDLPDLGPGYRSWRHMAVVRAALIRGDLETASALRPEMLRLMLAAGSPWHGAVALLVSAEVLGLRGEEPEARAHIERALDIARTMRSPSVEFMARLTEARLCFHNGQETDGLASLRMGMALGKAGGFVNSYMWQPSVMARLCTRALEAGVEVEYVQSLVRRRRLVISRPPVDVETWPWRVKVYTLGRFEILKDDQPLRFAGKVQRKPLALLKAMIAVGGRAVREQALMDALWPASEGDAARFALTTALHRLRRLLGADEAIIRKDNHVGLDPRYCWVDVWAVERLLERAEASGAPGARSGRAWDEAIRCVQRAAELYGGPFLGGDADAPSSSLADGLRRRLLRQLVESGSRSEQAGQWLDAAAYYEKGLSLDPCAEDVCRRLMTTYDALGRRSDALQVYLTCRDALAARLDLAPSVETDTLFKRLRKN
jgi:ATP/maltotriose-dependent transcriptional regulator MalT/DNA-binding SARP family transcriptional activator